MKKRTPKEIKALAKELFIERETGTSAVELSEKYKLHVTRVRKLLREYKLGKYGKPECPPELNEILLIDQNKIIDQTGMVEIIVYQDDDISKNFKLNIERPANESAEKFEHELPQRIINKLRWMYAGKEFKIGV